MSTAIRLENVSKTFHSASTHLFPWTGGQTIHALRDVTLTIETGTIFALVGANGAGKTTLLKILSTLIDADAGRVEIDGHLLPKNAALIRRCISYAPGEDRGFYFRLSVRQNLHFFGALFNVSAPHIQKKLAEITPLLGLAGTLDRPFQELSSGMRQRVALARALLHDATVLLLDEPTRSLDPLSRRDLMQLFRHLAQDLGKTVVLATHDLEEAVSSTDRVGILHQGCILDAGASNEFPNAQKLEDYLRHVTSA